MKSRLMLAHGFALLTILSAMTASNADDTFGQSIVLPQNPNAWINSGPISTQAMAGKSVVLYFFEEGCPRCRENWPAVEAAVMQNQTKPVMLIAVNSGSSPAEVAQYVKRNRLKIPVIIDQDRSLEKQAGVGTISLNNIFQAYLIDGEGNSRRMSGGDIPAAMQAAAQTASWNVDPVGIPPTMIPLWRQIEFGNYAPAAKSLTRFRRDRKPDVKAAAERLQSYVDDKIAIALSEAESAVAADDSWLAFKKYEEVNEHFAGYELPDVVDSELNRLADDGLVAKELAGRKLWRLAQSIIESGRAKPARVTAMMSKIIKDHPGTEAARMAADIQ
ncbi:Thiol-disulfide oxidoreductase ResA [Rubripirellula amarantea]|uniref:Thiol-disulfide oxidoreductase ResA n=1 Tax=Rubripirellula amarantea TaxID=2527999 RepID=A0A5C5WHC1_9BACT|nr:TlpA disulfide reductase family protein [Rubripirellula amarantea]TWT50188.1 Thiol-disulfide oxidoreductase ResA [Rubripirellula amarantea]